MSIIRKDQLENPLSASYAITASYAENTNTLVNTSSLLITASSNLNIITFTKGNGDTFPITIDTGSNNSNNVDTGSFVTTSSFNSFTSSINSFTSSYNTGSFTGSFTGSLQGTSSYALNTNSTPKGGANSIQFNNNGEFGGSSNFTYNSSSNMLSLTGSIKLSGILDPDPTGLTAMSSSFIFVSASNTSLGYDLYVRQDGDIVKFKWIEGGISTGLLFGGKISGSGQTIYVSSGSGIIMTSNAGYNQEINPIYTYVTWGNYSSSITYLTSSQNTYLYVDNQGIIHQQPNYFTSQQYQESICLGRIVHTNYSSISNFGSNIQTTYDSDAQQNEFIRIFGPLKVNGLTLSGQSGSLNINVGAGTTYNLGGFYDQNPDHPSGYDSAVSISASISRAYRSGSGVYLDNNNGNYYNNVDPTKWDDGTGVLNTVSPGQCTIQRVFYNPVSKRCVIYYGQTIYNSLSNAQTNLLTDPFIEGEFTSKSLVFVGFIIVKGSSTNLTNTSETLIVQSGFFRNSIGGSGNAGSINLTLDELSDVNISSPTNGQILTYNGGVWVNSNNVDTGSFVTTSSFNSFTSSINNYTSSINSFTSSYNTGSFTGSFIGSFIGSFTGSLQGTSSWSQNSITSSYTLNTNTSSLLITASANLNTITFTKGNGDTFSITINAGSVNTGSFVTTSSFNLFTSSYNTGSFTGSFIGNLQGTSSWSISSSQAITSSFSSTSSYATRLEGYVNYKNTADILIQSGSAGVQFVRSQLIPANTFSNNNVIRIRQRIRRNIGNAGTVTMGIYYNSVNTISGAIAVGVSTAATNQPFNGMKRDLYIKSGSTEVISTSSNLQTDDIVTTVNITNLSIDWTVDQYIIFTVQAASLNDSFVHSGYQIEKI